MRFYFGMNFFFPATPFCTWAHPLIFCLCLCALCIHDKFYFMSYVFNFKLIINKFMSRLMKHWHGRSVFVTQLQIKWNKSVFNGETAVVGVVAVDYILSSVYAYRLLFIREDMAHTTSVYVIFFRCQLWKIIII